MNGVPYPLSLRPSFHLCLRAQFVLPKTKNNDTLKCAIEL